MKVLCLCKHIFKADQKEQKIVAAWNVSQKSDINHVFSQRLVVGSNVKFTQFELKTKTHITTLFETDHNENSLFLYLVLSLWKYLGTWRCH